MSMADEILSLKEQVLRLREKDKHFRVYNSRYHKYEFKPALSEAEIKVFEDKYRIDLPEDYRLFLMLIGNGGAGPDRGLSSLSVIHPDDAKPDVPFRWRANESLFDEEFDEFYDERPGVIELVNYGYETDFLVVNGESYGTIWTEYPQYLMPTGKAFLKYYKDWLDRKLERLEKDSEIDAKIDLAEEGMSKAEVVNVLGIGEPPLYEKKESENELWLIFKDVPARFFTINDSIARIDRFDTLMDNPKMLFLPW